MSPFRQNDPGHRKAIAWLRRDKGIMRAIGELARRAVAWLLRPTPRAWSVVAYTFVAACCVTLAFQWGKTGSLARRVALVEHRQAVNRAENVAVWCNAIQRLDMALASYVALFHGVPPLDLPALDCRQLERRTRASGP